MISPKIIPAALAVVVVVLFGVSLYFDHYRSSHVIDMNTAKQIAKAELKRQNLADNPFRLWVNSDNGQKWYVIIFNPPVPYNLPSLPKSSKVWLTEVILDNAGRMVKSEIMESTRPPRVGTDGDYVHGPLAVLQEHYQQLDNEASKLFMQPLCMTYNPRQFHEELRNSSVRRGERKELIRVDNLPLERSPDRGLYTSPDQANRNVQQYSK